MKVKDAAMQAFPFIEPADDPAIKVYHPGMTMRDEFAKAAMQALITASGNQEGDVIYDEELVAKSAYITADAMMKARNQ